MQIIDALTYLGPPAPNTPHRAESAEPLPDYLSRVGIHAALSLSTTGVYYDWELGNRETLDYCRPPSSHSTQPRILPAATVDLRKYCGGKLAGLKDQGFRALRLPNSAQGWSFDYAPFWLALQEAAEVRLPVIVDTPGIGSLSVLARVCPPKPPPIIATYINYGNLAEAICAMRRIETLCICTDHLNSPDGIEVVVRELGSERLIFGTGAPFEEIEPCLITLEAAKIGEDERQMIAGGNLSNMLGL